MKKHTVPGHRFGNASLFRTVKGLIEQSRNSVARTVNEEITFLYWNIGMHIRRVVLREKRAAYGDRVIDELSMQLIGEYGSGYSAKNLRHFLRFAEVYPNKDIVSALRRQLSWSHIKILIYLNAAVVEARKQARELE